MSNGIAERQNRKENLLKIVAIKNLNNRARNLVKLQIFLVSLPVMVATITVITKTISPEIAIVPPLLGFIVTLSNFILIYPKISQIRIKAFLIQQDFDCDVLELPWNRIKLEKPKSEDINSYTLKYLEKDSDLGKIDACYPLSVTRVPLSVGRIICQRKFLGGDSRVRKKFIRSVKLLVMVLFILSVIFATLNSFTIFQFLSNLLLPFLPAAVFITKLIQDNSNSINRSMVLKNKIENIWDEVLLSGVSDEKLFRLSLKIQDELFEKRKIDPVILNYFYEKFRDELPSSRYTPDNMVEEYLSQD
ncbi:MAG: S-4TM family putative pore-forming effector [Methanobacterium formicicum]